MLVVIRCLHVAKTDNGDEADDDEVHKSDADAMIRF